MRYLLGTLIVGASILAFGCSDPEDDCVPGEPTCPGGTSGDPNRPYGTGGQQNSGAVVEPVALADSETEMHRDGASYSSLGVCTPLFVTRSAKSYGRPAFADHDLTVTFVLSDPWSVTAALYTDETCQTKASADLTADSGRVSADYVMKAGATVAIAYVLAAGTDADPSTWTDGSLRYGFKSPAGYADDSSTSTLWFSKASEQVDDAPVALGNFGYSTGIAVGACTRVPFVLDSDDSIAVAKNDVPIAFGIEGNADAFVASDSLCTTPIGSTTLKAGLQEVSVFLKATSLKDFIFRAASPDPLASDGETNIELEVHVSPDSTSY